MKAFIKIWLVSILVVCAFVSAPVAAPGPQTRATQAKKPVAPTWPDDKTLEAHRLDAEGRQLFAKVEPLAFTLTANFKAIENDRKDATLFPATISYTKDDGSTATIPLQTRTRGHERRMIQSCQFAPLRLEFQKDQVKGTLFDGQHYLKLGTHCKEDSVYEQYVLREYAVYKIFNLISPRSCRVRLAKGTYVDAATKKPLSTRYAMFVEDDDDVAKRMVGKVTDQQKLSFRNLDKDTLDTMMVFEYMIGNTDVSIFAQHNVKTVTTPAGVIYPVPYDFDYSGAVNTQYAIPAEQLHLGSVRERVYRGACRTPAELEPVLAKFRAAKAGVAAVYDAIPDFNAGYKKDVLGYFDQFYKKLDTPDDIKKTFIDKCLKEGVM